MMIQKDKGAIRATGSWRGDIIVNDYISYTSKQPNCTNNLYLLMLSAPSSCNKVRLFKDPAEVHSYQLLYFCSISTGNLHSPVKNEHTCSINKYFVIDYSRLYVYYPIMLIINIKEKGTH